MQSKEFKILEYLLCMPMICGIRVHFLQAFLLPKYL